MNKLTKIIGTGFLLISLSTRAQDCPELAGQYTIGQNETADFSSVNDAVSALNCGGVSGPVIFMIESGTYNEKVQMSSVSGVSAFNTVTFESQSGNSADVVISYSTSDATLVLNGTSYVAFENITIDHQAGIYGNCIRVDGKANNVNFKGVVMNGVKETRTGVESAAVYFTSTASKSEIVFDECEINNGSIGISKGGMANAPDSKTIVKGTLFFNQYESALALSNEDAPVVTTNVVTTNSTYTGYKAMSFDKVSNNMVMTNNIISAVYGSGLVMNNCSTKASNPGQIENNSIAIDGNTDAYGICISGSTDNQVLNFNRIKLTIDKAAAGSQGFFKNNSTGNNINVMNNICYDLNAGTYIILGNSYKDFFNQMPSQSNSELSASANSVSIEKAKPIIK